MSAPELWMPLHISRYLMDTKDLDLAQHGAYLLLLMQYWQKGPLPDDDGKLCRIIGIDLRTWRKAIAPALRPFFTTEDGKLHQKRADLELAKAADISGKRRAAALASHRHPPNGDGGGEDPNSDEDASGGANAHANAPANGAAKALASAPKKGANAPAHAPHTVPKKTKEVSINNLLTFKQGTHASAREEVPVSAENSAPQSEPAADPQAVAFELGKVVGKISHKEYARGAYQPAAEVYKAAAERHLRPGLKPLPLVGDHLIAARRAAGIRR